MTLSPMDSGDATKAEGSRQLEARLKLDVMLGKKRLAIERLRERRKGKFFSNVRCGIDRGSNHASLGLASSFQFLAAQSPKRDKTAAEINSRQTEQSARRDDQRLRILQYLTDNRPLMFADDPNKDVERKQLRIVMLAGLPPESVRSLFEQLRRSTPRGGQSLGYGRAEIYVGPSRFR